jgi:uridine kinase
MRLLSVYETRAGNFGESNFFVPDNPFPQTSRVHVKMGRTLLPKFIVIAIERQSFMTKAPLVIGIAGGTGSGKTTISNLIIERVGQENIAVLSHDAYYRDRMDLPLKKRARLNYDHPDSLETELLVKHVKALKKGKPVEMPVYDFTNHNRKQETVAILPQPVILVDGILIFVEKNLRELFDVKIFVDTDPDIRFIRRLRRDIRDRGRTQESVIQQYLKTVRPMHLEFVEPSKRYADVIIPEGGMNQVALDMVTARIEGLLQKKE